MTELEAARQIRDGLLPSPWKHANITLFAVRITGTGAAYRSSLDEFVWRDPSLYLNDEFLARVSGLPLIWEHPEKGSLNSQEFAKRVIGSLMFGYIKGDEVWGIARVYDDEAIRLMEAGQLSTSPGVVFSPADGNATAETEDGKHLLIEGVPSTLCHLAVCAAGVWDKGGPPAGVLTDALTETSTSTLESLGMTEEEKAAAEKARSDANAKLDSIISGLGVLKSRMDSFEAARRDAEDKEKHEAEEREAGERRERENLEKERADKARRDAARKDRFGARKDGESEDDYKARHDADEKAMCDALTEGGDEKEAAADAARRARKDAEEAEEKERADRARRDAEEKERADRARKDSVDSVALRAEVEALRSKMAEITRQTSPEDRDALAAAQSRADSVAAMFGERVDPPLAGETPLAYRKRLLERFKKHSPEFKESRFDSADAAMLGPVEKIVYADAVEAARRPAAAPAGLLFREQYHDEAGRVITKWHGDPMGWMQHFSTGAQVGRIIRNPNAVH